MSFYLNINRTIIILLLLYALSVFVKFFLSFQIPSPYLFYDELVYSKMAHSFISTLQFIFQDRPTGQFPPLYPMTISPFFLLPNMEISYVAIKFMNALFSSLVIFPVWMLGRQFLEKKYVLILIIFVLISPVNIYSSLIMSENLFYPLFIFSIFFIYESYIQKNLKFDFLCGVCIGLCFLTKTIGLVLFGAFVIVGLFYSHQYFRQTFASEKNKVLKPLNLVTIEKILEILPYFPIIDRWKVFFFTGVTIFPWIIRNGMIFGFSWKSVLGYENQIQKYVSIPITFESFLHIILFHLDYILIGSGFILFFSFIYISLCSFIDYDSSQNDNNIKSLIIITWSSMLFLILMASYHVIISISSIEGYYRLQGRYISPVIPLLLLLGIIGLIKIHTHINTPGKTINLKMVIASGLTFFLLIIAFPIEFVNAQANTSGPHLLFLKYFQILNISNISTIFLISFSMLFLIILFLKRILKINSLMIVLSLFLISMTYIAYDENIRMSHWIDDENDIAQWFYKNENNRGLIVIENQTVPMYGSISFWVNNTIINKNMKLIKSKSDFFVSQKKYNKTLLYQNKNWNVYCEEYEQ